MLFEQVPQVLQVLFLKHFTRLVLQKAGTGLLAYLEVQGVLIGGFLEEEARDGLERWISLFFNLLLLLQEFEELDIGFAIVLCRSLVLLAFIETLQLLDPGLGHENFGVSICNRS